MFFLDCVYLICCNFYRKREKDIFKVTGLLLLTLILMLNISFVLFLAEDYSVLDFELYPNRALIVISLMLVLIPILYFRFFKVTNYDEINNRFFRMNLSKRQFYHVSAVMYIFLSIVSCFGYAIYIGEFVK